MALPQVTVDLLDRIKGVEWKTMWLDFNNQFAVMCAYNGDNRVMRLDVQKRNVTHAQIQQIIAEAKPELRKQLGLNY